MPLILRWKQATSLPVEGQTLRPDKLADRSSAEISRRLIHVGHEEVELGDLFEISGNAGDYQLRLEGRFQQTRRIGRGMTSGSIEIHGDCGDGLGQEMVGGEISVNGCVGNSAGMAMRGGLLRIRGSAGNNLGGAEPGARLGMREGVILVEGSVGADTGFAMRRGLIAVAGESGDGLGRGMIAGSIFAFGKVGQGAGRGMKRGSIVLFQQDTPRISSGFWSSGFDRPTFVSIYLKNLRDLGFPIPEKSFEGTCSRYNGDRAERGQGEILVVNSSSLANLEVAR